MFGVIKFVLWTACAVGLGIFLAKGEIDGRTPIEHAERAWKRHEGGLRNAFDDAKETVSEKTSKRPSEKYSDDERAAIDKLISKTKN
ncbi:MAG: hypothetical protein WBV82_17450 [Myxococcaceae bacterium]